MATTCALTGFTIATFCCIFVLVHFQVTMVTAAPLAQGSKVMEMAQVLNNLERIFQIRGIAQPHEVGVIAFQSN